MPAKETSLEIPEIIYLSHSMLLAHSAEVTHITETIRHLQTYYQKVTLFMPYSARNKLSGLSVEKYYSPYTRNGVLDRLLFILMVWPFLIYKKATSRKKNALVLYIRHGAVMPLVILTARMLNIPVVLEVNALVEFSFLSEGIGSRVFRLFFQFLEKLSLRRADAIISVSQKLADYLKDEFGISENRLKTIHNGANIQLFRVQDADVARKKLGLNPIHFYLGFVGHFRPWHGIDELLHSYATYLSAEQRERIHLLIVGGGESERYQNLVTELAISPSVHLVGAKPYAEVPEWIAAMDLCLAPGNSQKTLNFDIRSPIKVYEYLACGKPVVASFLESLEELFRSHQIGCLIPNGRWDLWWQKIVMLEQEAELRTRMGHNARAVAEEKLSWSETIRQVAAAIDEVCKPLTEPRPLPS